MLLSRLHEKGHERSQPETHKSDSFVPRTPQKKKKKLNKGRQAATRLGIKHQLLKEIDEPDRSKLNRGFEKEIMKTDALVS